MCIMSLSDLQPAVQTPGDGDALAGLARAAQRLLQRLQCALGKDCETLFMTRGLTHLVLLELLDEGVDRLLGPLLLLVALSWC